MRYIILFPDKNNYAFHYFKSDNCETYNVYKKTKCNKILRCIRKLLYFFGFGINYCLYDDWKNFINDKNVQFIVFDSCKPYHRLEKVLKKCANKPIIYFWNPIDKEKSKIKRLKKLFDVYSYSEKDCKLYELKFNGQFLPNLPKDNLKIVYDSCFLGKSKNRLNLILNVYNALPNSWFYIVGDEINDKIKMHSERYSYLEYLKRIQESKCIVEVLPSSNAGFTLRTIEAIYYDKKLITNNLSIRNCSFYNKNMILIFDEKTSQDEIINFLSNENIPYSNKIKQQFSFEQWLKNFGKE